MIDFDPARPPSYNPGMSAAAEIALWNNYYETHAPAPVTITNIGTMEFWPGVTTSDVVNSLPSLASTPDLLSLIHI